MVATPATLAPLGHVDLPPGAVALREEVREFIRDALGDGVFRPEPDGWHSGFSEELSRRLGERGWLGMTWPKEYGGHERTALEQFVVREELLAAGAPVAAHWIADRQSGPQILRWGTEDAKRMLLSEIAVGACYFAIGMSEPNSGSDLASVRTSARQVKGGYLLSGRKIWTSHAHRSHYMMTLCRTSGAHGDRHEGLSVLIVPLSASGVEVRPIEMLDGREHFCEVTFDDVYVGSELVLGERGRGWELVTSELSLERAGPERILSTYPLLASMSKYALPHDTRELGVLLADLWMLRRLSLAVAAELDAGRDPIVEAALVKDLGTDFEQRVVDAARRFAAATENRCFANEIERAVVLSPGFTIRGGTTEILRGIVARALTNGR